MRQIILDTETTGLEPSDGHRIIEIGCIELINRKFTGNNFHIYINPEREVDAGALKIHGITNTFLRNKPKFHEIFHELYNYVNGSELIMHNAPFDVKFLNYEIMLSMQKVENHGIKKIEQICEIIDTLQLARQRHPGQRNSLDALCKRYHVDNSNRKLHGALLDAEILAKIYLRMTGGQSSLFDATYDHHSLIDPDHDTALVDLKKELGNKYVNAIGDTFQIEPSKTEEDTKRKLPVIKANAEELKAHKGYLEKIKNTIWREE